MHFREDGSLNLHILFSDDSHQSGKPFLTQSGSSVVMCSYRNGCWECICLSHCNMAGTVTSSECHWYLEHCLSYFSTVMTKHHDPGNLKNKAFNWESWFQRVVEFMTIMDGSMVTGRQEQ